MDQKIREVFHQKANHRLLPTHWNDATCCPTRERQQHWRTPCCTTNTRKRRTSPPDHLQPVLCLRATCLHCALPWFVASFAPCITCEIPAHLSRTPSNIFLCTVLCFIQMMEGTVWKTYFFAPRCQIPRTSFAHSIGISSLFSPCSFFATNSTPLFYEKFKNIVCCCRNMLMYPDSCRTLTVFGE